MERTPPRSTVTLATASVIEWIVPVLSFSGRRNDCERKETRASSTRARHGTASFGEDVELLFIDFCTGGSGFDAGKMSPSGHGGEVATGHLVDQPAAIRKGGHLGDGVGSDA